MAYVAENKKFNTNYGKIKNNNSRNTIERNNVALFNFSISEVTVEDGGLTVVCDTITGDTIEYSLDLDGDKCEFTEEMYNYTVGGSIEIFLALVWKLYLSTLDDEGVQQDTETYEQLRDIIAALTKDNADLTTANETLSGQVETLQGQLEAAQSQAGSGSNVNTSQLSPTQIFTVGSTDYAIKIAAIGTTGAVYFVLPKSDQTHITSVNSLGFTSQRGAATYANTTDNTSITVELYFDGTVQTAGISDSSSLTLYIGTGSAIADGTVVCVKVTITDSSNEVLSSAYDSMTYVAPVSESEGEGE